ncbi:Endogenous retrovirus group K member 19 Env polyprotein [Plecturocebus cupreus]
MKPSEPQSKKRNRPGPGGVWCKTAKLSVSGTKVTQKANPPAWGQMKRLVRMATASLRETRMEVTPGSLILAAAMVTTAVGSNSPVSAEENCMCWAYVPFPPLIRPITWMDTPIEVYINYSIWMPGPTDDRCPAQPQKEGMFINVSLGPQSWLLHITRDNRTGPTYHIVSGMSFRPNTLSKIPHNGYSTTFEYTHQYKPKGESCSKTNAEWSPQLEILTWKDCVADRIVILQDNTRELRKHCLRQASCVDSPILLEITENLITRNNLTERIESPFPIKWEKTIELLLY